jgi:uncharacterized protein (TIGR02453 family)
VTAFAGFTPEAFAWFTGLEADAFEAMMLELAAELGGDVKIFRQNRDVRFSPDKSPYKTQTYGLIHDRPENRPVLYAQISARGLFAGSGYHVLAADQLARFRDAVADERTGPALEEALAHAEDAGAETYGETLRTAPRGYRRDHPRITLLRHKALVGGGRLEPGDDGIGRDAALGHARRMWAACEPMNAWLDANVGASKLPVESRFGRRRGRGS